MNETPLIQRENELLRSLFQLAADRHAAEQKAETDLKEATESAEQEFQHAHGQITVRFENERQAMERESEEVRNRVLTDFESEHGKAERDFAGARDEVRTSFKSDEAQAKKEFDDARWEASALFEGDRNSAKDLFKEYRTRIEAGRARVQAVETGAVTLLDQWHMPRDFSELGPNVALAVEQEDLRPRFEEKIAQAELQLGLLKKLVIPKAFEGTRLRWAFLVFLGLSVAAMLILVQKPFTLTIWNIAVCVSCVVGPFLIGTLIRWLLFWIAKSQSTRVARPLVQMLADGEELAKRCMAYAEAKHKSRVAELQARNDRDVQRAEVRQRRAIEQARQRRDQVSRELEQKFPQLLAAITSRRDAGLKAAEEKYPRLLAEMRRRFEADSRAAEQQRERQIDEIRARHDETWTALARAWWQGMVGMQAELTEITQECLRLFPNWHSPSAPKWVPPEAVPPAIRAGEFTVSMDRVPHGVPTDPRLNAVVLDSFDLPALLPFPAGSSMVLKATDVGRDHAVQSLQAVMLRLLASIPPGKIRFTIIDPVGLGENFAAFMHLADHLEALVTNRIWTEPQHIDQRLVDLTEHMENVIQKYLRNEFETIEEYNAQAGEVAEPFRIVVVANFPANFNEATARRLISVASSGARCGVYTLVSVDTRLPMPHGVNLADLEHVANVFEWNGDRFLWRHPIFGKFPLRLDSPPPADVFTELVDAAGQKAKEASRVEVPFEFVAPRPDQYWRGDSRSGINVPLGRAGATKTQNMRLGQGTSQHVLIAGKTGSGKSTLLHALITNMSLLYSPDEVELYLVDFKKGVEFKTYATYELPHARVIAIESEREFGLSVLQRLDAELKRRGDLYRAAGVQDLAGYRQANGDALLPRILLIVDEFQEFFVEDDKIAQESALLLDRLVRQGRAFGIHIQLGSQTLGGAYSLARSTLGQMAVRIALQCSEADAHLILSDDNTAARLLSRPGEAIYNDANGLIEGNNFFQVVWLPDERREAYLSRVQEMARRSNFAPPHPQIVFEGNVPSDVRKNHLLYQLLTSPSWPAAPKVTHAWLGEAVAIKDPTAAVFRPQVGSNLLMIGQQDEAALAISLTSLVSLAAQHAAGDGSAGDARFFVLDGSPVDSPHAGQLARLARMLPHPIQVGGPRDVAAIVGSVAEEIDRRQKSNEADVPPIFLVFFDVQRFRDLRKQDDEFSFSRRGEDKPVSPAKQLGTILREGSAVRVHTIVWCDSLNNLNRTFERQVLREFDMRVLFQMSPGDSSTLIDTPLASKLGVHRALFYSEELGQAEKFRPYGLPSDDWLAWVRGQFEARSNSATAVAAATS